MSDEFERCLQMMAQCPAVGIRPLEKQAGKIRARLEAEKPAGRMISAFCKKVRALSAQYQRRLAALPSPDYDPSLPVVARRDAIRRAIAGHQVVIVAGETGSGKTTQIPKICLELKRGAAGMIGHTQPRRLAARSVAARIAQELHTELGQGVGYQVRFHDKTTPETYLKLMTDGILLAEIQADPLLLQYDTLIIDEAHERGLNTDFLLCYLKRLLPRRPDLKLIITSATIDIDKFSNYFSAAPVIEAQGRSYPVEVVYMPLSDVRPTVPESELASGVIEAVQLLVGRGPGDILVFLSGEREIREIGEALTGYFKDSLEIVPLFSRLSLRDQDRIFRPHGGRRVVLATNVAETSLTVPGIRYVVDSGRARISRYSHRHKVQRLPVEKISQASANQRKGRCGRLGPGVCVRLYDEQDFLSRDAYTEAEILRTNLASVILKTLTLRLGDIESFEFIDMPDRRYVNDGFRLLYELGAVDTQRRLTKLGRLMARLPIDPRLARILIASRDEGCVVQALVIVSFLSVQDPRERPLDMQQKADSAHRRFQDPESDFITIINLWDFYQRQRKKLSTSQLRKLCRTCFLSWPRMREWQEVYQQLALLLRDLDFSLRRQQIEADNLHRALLAGLLSYVGNRQETREYLGGHGKKFRIMPGSSRFKNPPKWVLAAEIVETSQVYARTVCAIDSAWLESTAAHLLKFSYQDPYWSRKRRQAMVAEQASLYGLVVYSGRRVPYAKVDPEAARRLFVRHGLVDGEFDAQVDFLQHNRRLVAQLKDYENRLRRRGVLLDEEFLLAFYLERLPETVVDGSSFSKWCRRADAQTLASLRLDQQTLVRQAGLLPDHLSYPEYLQCGRNRIRLEYCFSPGADEDGVVALIPEALLPQLREQDFEFLVPGMLADKLTALIRTLPKKLRRNFVPAPDYARACAEAVSPGAGPLLEQLSAQLRRMTGIELSVRDWRPEQLPRHLRMHYRLVDAQGRVLRSADTLKSLADASAVPAAAGTAVDVAAAGPAHAPRPRYIQRWDFGELADVIEREQDGMHLELYPALVATDGGVELRECRTRAEAEALLPGGLCGLFVLQHTKEVGYLRKNLPEFDRIAMLYAPLGKAEVLQQQLVSMIVRHALLGSDWRPAAIRNRESFESACRHAVKALMPAANRAAAALRETLEGYREVVGGRMNDSMRRHLHSLLYEDFLADIDYDCLLHYPRYLRALGRRQQRLLMQPDKDRMLEERVAPWQQQYEALAAQAADEPRLAEAVDRLRWMLEEFRVSVFAQELKTAYPVSAKRLQAQIERIRQGDF